MLLFALVRAVEIVGEAATGVSEETRTATSEIPSAAIVRMRHRLVHAYYEIDREVLWNTVEAALPALLRQLRSADRAE